MKLKHVDNFFQKMIKYIIFQWYKGVITCLETDSLKRVVDLLYSSEVHGLVVVDDEGKLRGVITLYDVLKFIVVDQLHASL